MRVLFPAFLIIFLCGCQTVSQSKSNLISKPGGKIEVQVNRPYKTVFRDVKSLLMDRKMAWIGNEWIIDADIDEERKTATASYTLLNMLFGASTYLYVKIEQVESESSKLTIYYSGWNDSFAKDVKNVAINGT
jgi:hypothetical protein